MLNRLRPAALWCAWFAIAFLTFGPSIGSRNGSGTMSVINSFSPGQVITSSAFNQNFSDIANELTNSVAADGQTPMTGPLRVANGTAAAPSYTFTSDADTGLYRSAANEASIAAGGTQVAAFSSTGIDAKAGKIREGGFALVPAGAIIDYAGTSAPDGWFFCYGQAISRTTYATLFAAIGTTHGVGDGSTTFNVPDYRGRVGAGKDDMGGSAASRLTTAGSSTDGATAGAVGGAQNRSILQANFPNVNFTVSGISLSDPGHSHPITLTSDGLNNFVNVGSNSGVGSAATEVATTGITIASQGTAASGGSGTALTTVQPTIVVNKIIKY